jgi:hypothetical protein
MSNSDKKPKFETPNLTVANVAKGAELFPGAAVEGKVNFDLLCTILGGIYELKRNVAKRKVWKVRGGQAANDRIRGLSTIIVGAA